MSIINQSLQKAIFIDKDGTLIPDIPYNINPELIYIEEWTIKGMKLLRDQGYLLIVITNQSGIAKGYFTESELAKVWQKISDILDKHGLWIDAFYYCPHEPNGLVKEYAITCDCRKPMPGLILRAAEDFNVDVSRSWMIGDILNDVEAGNKAGCKTILIDNGNETEWIRNEQREPFAMTGNIYEAARFILQYEHNDKDEYNIHGYHRSVQA